MGYRIQASCLCSIGAKRRNNEDNFYFDGKTLEEENEGLRSPVSIDAELTNGLCMAVFDGIREGNTPTRDSIPVHDGTHLKVSILREKNTSTNLWPKTFVWKHAAKPDREGYTTRSQKPMQTMDI